MYVCFPRNSHDTATTAATIRTTTLTQVASCCINFTLSTNDLRTHSKQKNEQKRHTQLNPSAEIYEM